MKWSLIPALLFSLPLSVANATDTQYPVTVDNYCSPLTIDKGPVRAVVHDINISEMAFTLCLQENMVGVTGITSCIKCRYHSRKGWKRSLSWPQNIHRWKDRFFRWLESWNESRW